MQDYMIQGAPPGSIAVTRQSGWMTADNFVKHAECLNVLDNHDCQISPKAYHTCKLNVIHLLTSPTHTSHRLQPLDVSLFGPFKRYYNEQADAWMITHTGQTILLKHIPNDTNHTLDTGTETDEIILNPGDDVDWANQILGNNHSVELFIVNDNSEPENHTPTTANELLHMDENTNLNNAELNVANENEHFMITQDEIDEILPNGVAAAIVVENVNNNYIENNEPISSMINLSQTATEVLIQPEEAREVSKLECDIDATSAKKCVVPVDIPSPLKSSLFWPTPKLNISKPKLK
ncbi:hypothetical protein JTB14_028357 [Gonioctena quinquepunctata]|nr:hypothetical protein JTB14_028357 [Gonioctena quinquepunctata]